MSKHTDILSDLFAGLRIVHRSSCSPVTISSRSVVTYAHRRAHKDPYVLAQGKARRAANMKRQEVLRGERAIAAGDPVRGRETPFLQSFDTATSTSESSSHTEHLNHFVTANELSTSLQHSKLLTTPIYGISSGTSDPRDRGDAEKAHAEAHANAREALSRITALSSTSSADRTRINIQRCIDTFGRHNTDTHLRPKPVSTAPRGLGYEQVEKTPRAGPDTGSSEVQIAILTAKIRALAGFVESRGRKDKANKRNLRLLVHRRQKLLRYMRRRERGSERWSHLIETLGLTEGTWKGEIEVV